MPSPFPGMDPFLEGPEFSGFGCSLIAEMARQLTPLLRPRYIARMRKWFSVDPVAGDDGFVPQHSLEIRDAAQHRVVMVIELLSPSNKRGDGHEQYLKRRLRFLRSSAHLMEIDLLRGGRRPPMRQELPAFPYFVFLSRVGRRPIMEAWAIALRDPLPVVPIPLLPGDADVPFNLQQALNTVYDQLAYDVSTDYSKPPTIPLSVEDGEWAQQRVRTWRENRPGAD
jgi:hypothetical protein